MIVFLLIVVVLVLLFGAEGFVTIAGSVIGLAFLLALAAGALIIGATVIALILA